MQLKSIIEGNDAWCVDYACRSTTSWRQIEKKEVKFHVFILTSGSGWGVGFNPQARRDPPVNTHTRRGSLNVLTWNIGPEGGSPEDFRAFTQPLQTNVTLNLATSAHLHTLLCSVGFSFPMRTTLHKLGYLKL
jgi:hypothetical protein